METKNVEQLRNIQLVSGSYSGEIWNSIILCIHCENVIEDPDNHSPWICTSIRA
jgi:hypothetical protein